MLTPQLGWSSTPIHDGPGDKALVRDTTQRESKVLVPSDGHAKQQGQRLSWWPSQQWLLYLQGFVGSGRAVASARSLILMGRHCSNWPGGDGLSQPCWDSALCYEKHCMLQSLCLHLLALASGSHKATQTPARHGEEQQSMQPAASPSCTFSLRATPELRPRFSPGPLAPAPLWLWQMKQYCAREGKHCYANTHFTDRETEPWAG